MNRTVNFILAKTTNIAIQTVTKLCGPQQKVIFIRGATGQIASTNSECFTALLYVVGVRLSMRET